MVLIISRRQKILSQSIYLLCVFVMGWDKPLGAWEELSCNTPSCDRSKRCSKEQCVEMVFQQYPAVSRRCKGANSVTRLWWCGKEPPAGNIGEFAVNRNKWLRLRGKNAVSNYRQVSRFSEGSHFLRGARLYILVLKLVNCLFLGG